MARTVVMPPESTVTMPMHSQIMRVLLRQRSEHWEIRGSCPFSIHLLHLPTLVVRVCCITAILGHKLFLILPPDHNFTKKSKAP